MKNVQPVSFASHIVALEDLRTWLDALMAQGWSVDTVYTKQEAYTPIAVTLELSWNPRDQDMDDALRNVVL